LNFDFPAQGTDLSSRCDKLTATAATAPTINFEVWGNFPGRLTNSLTRYLP
jgi:hypothetical protein